MFFIELGFAVILTELLTELAIKSVIFKPVRKFIGSLGGWFAELASCGYCFSVWAALGVVFLVDVSYNFTEHSYLNLFLTALIVHRLSNYLHNFYDKYLDKYYDCRYINSEKDSEE